MPLYEDLFSDDLAIARMILEGKDPEKDKKKDEKKPEDDKPKKDEGSEEKSEKKEGDEDKEKAPKDDGAEEKEVADDDESDDEDSEEGDENSDEKKKEFGDEESDEDDENGEEKNDDIDDEDAPVTTGGKSKVIVDPPLKDEKSKDGMSEEAVSEGITAHLKKHDKVVDTLRKLRDRHEDRASKKSVESAHYAADIRANKADEFNITRYSKSVARRKFHIDKARKYTNKLEKAGYKDEA